MYQPDIVTEKQHKLLTLAHLEPCINPPQNNASLVVRKYALLQVTPKTVHRQASARAWPAHGGGHAQREP